MSVETALLLLESVLLAATIALLVYNTREMRQRNNLIVEVSKATKTLTRLEYFLAVTDSIAEAEKEIIGCVTGHQLSGDEDKRRIKSILSGIEKATKRGVQVRYLLPKFHDRLHMGYLYTRAGAEVRYSTCAMVYSLRYNVVDSRLVVMGIPESVSEEASTRKGHRLPSEALAVIMSQHFYGCWQKNPRFEEYLKEVLEQTGTSVPRLALELGIEAKELEAILARLPQPKETSS